MRDAVERELQQHALALRGLARDLVGAGDADDVLQETALEALRTPPRRAGPLGAWLAAVVRHVASRHRRAERRRRVREQAVVGADVEAADAGAEAADTLRFLTDAVLALPEPYRGALLARYLRDLTPAEIAARTRVPLGTVKTRLKRGLVLLRARLDAQHRARGGDWRATFVAAFGLERPTEVVAGAGTAAGVVLMTAGTKIALGTVAAALAVTAWLLVGGSGSPSAPPSTTRTEASASLATATGIQAHERAADPGPAGDAGPPERTGVEAGAARVVVLGRLVDEAGAPLPGLAVELRGSQAEAWGEKDYQREYGEWLRTGGPGPQALATTSAADGRFAFAIEPSPLTWQLHVRRDGQEHGLSLSQKLEAQRVDLGDLVVPATCTLTIRVVEASGRPVPTPLVRIEDDRDPNERASQAERRLTSMPGAVHATSDGVTATVVAGRYRVQVGREVVRGTQVDVPPLTTHLAHEVVVAVAPHADTITGTVVDERGQPLADVEIRGWKPRGGGTSASTDLAGRFVLARLDPWEGEIELSFDKDGYHRVCEPRRVAWGTHGQRFVLRDLPTFEVRVVEAATGKPVPHFAVRMWVAPGASSSWNFGAGGRRVSGVHEHGVVHLRGLPEGPILLLVEPHRWDLARSEVVPLAVTGAFEASVEVRLPPAAERTLLVRHVDGRPVAGASVAVAHADATSPEPIGVGARLVSAERWEPTQLPAARILVQEAATDASGRATLHGPARRELVARVSGEGFAPFLVGPFVLDEPEPLVATLPAACTVVVRVGPPEFVRELREAQDSQRQGNRPGFRLRRGTGQDAELVPPRSLPAVLLDDEDSFTVGGVPAGDWHVALETWEVMPGGSRSVWTGGQPIDGAHVTLVSGRTTELAVDLSSWLPGEIHGVVRCNGEVVANARIGIEVARRLPDYPGLQRTLVWAQTDAEGRFRYRGRGGEVRVVVDRSDWQRWDAGNQLVPSRATATLPPRGTVEQDFDATAVPLRLRVLTASGAPAVDLPLLIVPDGSAYWPRLCRPDQTGRIATFVEPDTFTVQLEPSRTPIGRVTVVEDGLAEVELRLPAEHAR